MLGHNSIGWAFWPYKKMQAASAPVSYAPPVGWNQIVTYARLPHGDGSVKERMKERPPQALIDAALAELLENIQLQKCSTGRSVMLGHNSIGWAFWPYKKMQAASTHAGYIHALLPGAP
jgi:cbb3-type cytochrome oxidase subunit 3